MENINITNADFSSSMPKWATEDTLQRLLRFLDREANKGRRENQKLQALIGKMYENSRNSSTIDKSILQEIKTLNKTISSKSKSGSSSTGGVGTTTNKKTEDLLHKTNDLLKRIYQKIPNNTGSQQKQQQSSTSNTQSSSQQSSAGISTRDIRSLEKTIVTSNRDVVKAISGINSNRIQTAVSKTQSSFGGGTANSRIDAILNKTQKDLGKSSGMIGRAAKAYSGSTKATSSKSMKAMKVIGRVVKIAFRFAKFIPIIGGIITALSSVFTIISTVAEQGKKFAWDAQKEYKAMLKSGFSFGIETIEQGIQMDGIRLQKMMNKSGLTIEQGMALLEKNAVLVNNLGVEGVFSTISNVADMQMESGRSFQDQMLLSREEIGSFTTQYLASTMNMIRTEQMSSEQRTKAAQQFIKDARQFGQVTGQGMQEIIDKMASLRKTEDYKLTMLAREPEDRAMLERGLTMFQSLDLPSHVQDRMIRAMMDTRGLGMAAVDGGAEMRNQLSAVVGEDAAGALDDIIRDMQTGNMGEDEFEGRMASLLERFEVGNIDVNSQQVQAILAGGSQASKDMVHLIRAFQNARKEGLATDGGTGADQSSELVNKQQEAQSAIDSARNTIERVAIETADRESSRNLMTDSLALMKSGADVGAKTVGLLGSILAGIIDMASGVVNAIKSLGRIIIAGLNKVPGINIKTEEEKAREDFYDSHKTTFVKGGVDKVVADVTGVTPEYNSFTGRATRRVKRKDRKEFNRKLEEHAKEIYEKAMGGDKEASNMLMGLVSSRDEEVSKIYKGFLDSKLDEKGADVEHIYKALQGKIDQQATQQTPSDLQSNTPTPTNVGVTATEATEQIPSDLQSNNQASPIATETNTIAQQQAAQQAEEQKRIQEEQAAQQRAAQQRAAQPTPTGTTTATQNTTQASINNQQQNQNSQVSVDFGSVNTKLDELIRLQKEFNRNMTIQIIKA